MSSILWINLQQLSHIFFHATCNFDTHIVTDHMSINFDKCSRL
jgi:hypothetical protein